MTQTHLSETYIQDSFHSYLKSSLTQAKAERLLDVEVLSSAEGDLMITGPALCLYFAALRSTTDPPSVPLPRASKSSQPMDLSYDNCPPAFISFLRVWAHTVSPIQDLPPDYQHDLARVICGLPALSEESERSAVMNGIAADLRAVAIEIGQRRSFQDRYAADLQVAIDAGATPETPSPRKASFVPPPVYDASPSPSGPPSPRLSSDQPPPLPDLLPQPSRNNHQAVPPPSPGLLSPTSASFPTQRVPSAPPSPAPSRSPSPTFFTPSSPSIHLIRETLYAAIADVLSTRPSLRLLLKSDPPRAYFSSVAFAILFVSQNQINPKDGSITTILGKRLTLQECPPELRPLMRELGTIGVQAKEMEEEDTTNLIAIMQRGGDVPALSRLERVGLILEKGAGYEYDSGDGDPQAGGEGRRRRSVEGRAVAFANRVNGLALGMTKLQAFRERQDEVFKVLAGVSS